MIGAVLSLLGIGKAYVEGKQALKLKEATAKSDFKIKQLSDATSWAQLAAQKSSRFLRWFCAAHLFAGMDFTIYLALTGDPNPGIIFQSFELLPDWYAGLLMTLFGWAFASEKLSSAGAALAGKWRNRPRK